MQIQDVTKAYANHLALDKVSLSVPKQTIYGLLGPNGAGKTSLIRIINQITAPDSGEIFIDGEKLQPKHIAQIGYLPEERGLYKKMKVGEQALYLAQLKGVDKIIAEKRLKVWFERFEIMSWWNRKVEELSKGMQQKIQFVVTVIHEPRLLIFDEPFSGFDPINVNILKEEILRLRQEGATIIFSTHNMSSVEELCDTIALINNGNKILEGSVKEIKQQYRTNTYEVHLTSVATALGDSLPNGFHLLSKLVTGYNEVTATIQCDPYVKANDLLGFLMDFGQIVSYRELLPNVHDIFIQQIESQTDKN
ncbi:MAG: ABC transporter ATP-binding protein [Bacteroidales bacterium]|nr:ABC transporter ATP-binding protein [Bacteroidales bacterium]